MDDEDTDASQEVAADTAAQDVATPPLAGSDAASPHAHPNFVADLKSGAAYLLALIEKAPQPIEHLYVELKEALQKHAT